MTELEKENAELKLQLQAEEEGEVARYEVWNNRLTELEKENAELKEYTQNRDKQVQEDIKIITELNKQIEKMKCCGNCKHSGVNEEGYITCNANCFYDCRSSQVFDNKESKIDGWELAE